MKRYLLTLLLVGAVVNPNSFAQEPETFDQAKSLSAANGRPLLVEFYRDD